MDINTQKSLDNTLLLQYNSFCSHGVSLREVDWVWRSLVACLNGVQEAGGSNPLTQTKVVEIADVKMVASAILLQQWIDNER